MTAGAEILGNVARDEIEIVKRAFDAWNRRDVDAVVELARDDSEWVIAEESPQARTLRGKDEIRAYLRDWWDTVHGLHYEATDYLTGDGCVVCIGAVTGQVGAGGPELTEGLCCVVRFEDGLAVRVEEYFDADRARAAAGLG